MKTLETKEWIAVGIAVFVVGFFFIFGNGLISFFTNNKQTMNVTPNPEVLVEDSVVGVGEVAVTGNRVVVHYTGRFSDGTIFDSSLTRGEPFQFILGAGQVIQGWDQGIVGMKVGGKRTLTIPSELGYGPNDYGPIPGGSTLIFDVELLKVEK